MPYTTKPYILLCLGSSLRALTYEIDDMRTLHVRGLSGEIATIPLENAMARREDAAKPLTKFFRKAFDIGDVLVAAQGGQHLCKKVSGVQAFIAAINGTHPAVMPPPPPWYEGAELEDYVIKIPGMTQSMLWITRRAVMDAALNHSWQKKPGDWVKAGESVLKYVGGLNVVAPVSGKIIAIGSDDTDWSKEKGQPIESGNDWRNYVLQIRPVKDSQTDRVMEKTWLHIIDLVERILSNPRKHAKIVSDFTKDTEAQLVFDREDLRRFREFKPIVQPISQSTSTEEV